MVKKQIKRVLIYDPPLEQALAMAAIVDGRVGPAAPLLAVN